MATWFAIWSAHQKTFFLVAGTAAVQFRSLVYRSRRLFYCLDVPTPSEVEMLHLESGERSFYTGLDTGDSGFWGLFASDSYLVAFVDFEYETRCSSFLMTSNSSREPSRLFAWDLHTSERFVSEELSSRFAWITVEKDKMVIVDLDFRPLHAVYIWDIGSGCLRRMDALSNFYL